MQLKFLGAAGTVTGSSYVLTSSSGQSILIDLGMFQGTKEIEALNYQPFEYDTSQLLSAILTHAHLDHCGRLPLLVKGGFTGSIWMTNPTADLTSISLMDSAKIAREDKAHQLYNEELALDTIDRFTTTDYHKPVNIGDFTVTFYDAGHILGSASLLIEDKSSGKKIVFSGDIGNYPEYLVKETEMLGSADYVVMESTYGGKLHPTNEDPIEVVQTEINKAEQDKSVLLIPAFSLERTQEILHIIKHLKEVGKVSNDTPVYMDSPMAERATEVYMHYPQIFNDHIREEMKIGAGPFDFPGLWVTRSHRESQKLQRSGGPMVIIAGSGMMAGGRIVGHAAHFLTSRSNRLLLVGYQGDETLGRELLEGEREVFIDDEQVEIKASVNSTHAMSSHADQGQLMNWLSHINGVSKVFLTHGEDESRQALSEKIKSDLKINDIYLPVLNEEVSIT